MSDTLDAVAHAKQLNEQRLKAWEEGKRLLDDVAQEKRNMSGEEHAEWTRINADIDRLDQERDVYLQASRRETESAAIRDSEFSQFGEQRVVNRQADERRYVTHVVREIAARPAGAGAPHLEVDVLRARQEVEMIRAGFSPADARETAWGDAEARALAWDTGSVASAVPITVARSLYQYMEASIAMFKIPSVTMVPTGGGETMYFPKLAAHAIATQVSGQGTTLAGTDPTFARMQLDAFKYGELVIVANEVINDAVVDIGQFLGRDIGRALGRKIDTDLVVGSGSGAPQGVMSSVLVGSAGTIFTGGTAITPTYENLVDLVYSVNDEYRANGANFLMRDATAGILRKLRADAGGTSGPVLWEPSLTNGIQNGQPDRLLGYPVYIDPNVASCASNAKIIAFGDFSAYYLRTVGNVVIDRDDSRYFDTDQVGFRGKWRVDGDVIDLTAINLLKQSVT